MTALISDMGLPQDSVVVTITPKMFKAPLNMDACVLSGGGFAAIHACQQWLNATYTNHGRQLIGRARATSRAMSKSP